MIDGLSEVINKTQALATPCLPIKVAKPQGTSGPLG